jgi:hypothetical protein
VRKAPTLAGQEALARGEYAPFETRVALVFAALAVVLGLGTIIAAKADSPPRT